MVYEFALEMGRRVSHKEQFRIKFGDTGSIVVVNFFVMIDWTVHNLTNEVFERVDFENGEI